MVGQRRGTLRRGEGAALGSGDRYSMDRAAYEAARARARDGVRAALYVPAGMPDRVDGLPVEMGGGHQPGFPRAEELDVCADARRVWLVRSVPQARAVRRR